MFIFPSGLWLGFRYFHSIQYTRFFFPSFGLGWGNHMTNFMELSVKPRGYACAPETQTGRRRGGKNSDHFIYCSLLWFVFFLIKVCAPSDCSLIQLLFPLLIEMKLLKTKLTRIVLFSFSFHLFFHLQGTSSINRNKLTYLMVVNASHNNKSYY